MNTHINQLLEKYWAGESSLKEEQEIRSYFAAGDIAEEHQAIAPMFGLFTLQQKDHCEKDLTAMLESKLEQDSDTRNGSVDRKGVKLFQLRKFIMATAAIFAIVMTAVIVMNQDNAHASNDAKTIASNHIILDGSEDSEEALRVTKEALAFLTGKLKKNGKKVNSGIQNLDKINVIH